jgi:hypothetical protein
VEKCIWILKENSYESTGSNQQHYWIQAIVAGINENNVHRPKVQIKQI